jgi:hypothetical protein
MLTAADEPVALQLYRGLNDLGGQLWEQEVRVLLRLTARGHPALPRILDGGYEEVGNLGNFGFAVAESANLTLASDHAMRELRERKADCIRMLAQLGDALALLHGQGVMHRNLHPGTIAAVCSTPDRIDRLRLERFEMSGLITNVLRRPHRDEVGDDKEVRGFLRSQGPRALAYFPPERVALLDPATRAPGGWHETDSSDVYALGVLGWEIFLGPLPPALLAGLAVGTEGWARALNGALRGELRRADLPRPLADLLMDMLDPDGRTRITSSQVVDRWAKHSDGLSGRWGSNAYAKPSLVLFQPVQSGPTVYEWRWIAHPPDRPEGKVALREFLENELRGARLVYEEDGAKRYVSPGQGADNRADAKYILLGRQGAWFCTLYQDRYTGTVHNEALLIKYVQKREKTRSLDARPSVRRVSAVDARDWGIGDEALAEEYNGRPDWRPLFDAVKPDAPPTPWQRGFAQAVDWLLDLQLVELRAREYPFRAEVVGNFATLCYDKERDRERIDKHRDPVYREHSMLFWLYDRKAGLRKGFAEFFSEGGEDDVGRLELLPDDDGKPDYSRPTAVWFKEAPDEQTIRVARKPEEEYRIPVVGWVRFSGDRGDFESHKRQLEARDELMELRGLIDQFDSPTIVRGYHHRWRDAGAGLDGDSPKVVRDLLASQPFFAIHGPPGTGKSTVTAEAVCAYLAAERAARVLVSAQSNFALDNLALKIRKTLEGRGQKLLAIRIASRETEEKVDKDLRPWLLAESVPLLIRDLTVGCERRLQEREYTDRVKAVLGEWRAYLPDAGPELYDRLRRGASLVFATCAGATREKVDAVGSFGVYDWVVVEEAAKAWPTELALPLTRGLRWALVGDYKQLPAYRSQEVLGLLAACAASDHPDLRPHGDSQAEYRRVFALFESLFAPRGGRPARLAGPLARPLHRLTVQHRMRKAIAEVVSRAFYADVGGLQTAPSAEVEAGFESPDWLAGKALVWLDTAGVDGCVNRQTSGGSWSNEGEANLVATKILQRLDPPAADLAKANEEPLAVLTPYRAQIDLLQGLVPADARGRLFTPHEYQGREAMVVICSLVRDRARGAAEQRSAERRNFGHLAQPELVNVMFSRAKRLLVVVGRFSYYRDSGIPFWQAACQAFDQQGAVLPLNRQGAVLQAGGMR